VEFIAIIPGADLVGRAMDRPRVFRVPVVGQVRRDLQHYRNRLATATHATAVRAGGRSAAPMPQVGGC